MIRYEELPPDQRAVLSLLLRQRKRYDEVASALGIQPAAVHDRAHAALTVLAPSQARLVEPAARERIGEYLLGQQSPEEAAATKQYLADSTAAREWARTLAVELVKLAAHSLPEIPAAAGPVPPPATPAPAPAVAAPRSEGGAAAADASGKPDGTTPQISRRGGALLLACIVVVAAVVVAIVLSSGGSGGSNRSGNQAASRSSTKNESAKEEAGSHETSSSSPSTGSGKGKVKLEKLAEMKPTAVGSPAKGFAAIVSKEGAHAVEIEANGLPPTQGFSYVVWLTGANGEPSTLGRIPSVNSKGQVKVIEALATSPSSVKGIEISRETSAHPKSPGTLVLKGTFVGG